MIAGFRNYYEILAMIQRPSVWSKKAKGDKEAFFFRSCPRKQFQLFPFFDNVLLIPSGLPQKVFSTAAPGAGTPRTECLRQVAKGTFAPLFP